MLEWKGEWQMILCLENFEDLDSFEDCRKRGGEGLEDAEGLRGYSTVASHFYIFFLDLMNDFYPELFTEYLIYLKQ